MTSAQQTLGIIGAITCAALGLNMTDSGQGALIGRIGGFALGSMIPSIFELSKAFVVIGIALGLAVLAFLGQLPTLPMQGNLHLTNACSQPLNVHLWWRDIEGQWGGNGPWTFPANSAQYVSFTGGSRLVMTSGTIYFHTAMANGRIVAAGNDVKEICGQSFNMRRSDIGSPETAGHYQLTLTCS